MAWSKFILAKLPVQNLLHAIRSMHGQVCMGSIAIGPPTFLPLATPLRRRVLVLHGKGVRVKKICQRLLEEDIYISNRALNKLIKKYREHHTYQNLLRSKRRSVLTREQVKFIDKEMEKNDELTARKMHELLLERWPNLNVSLSTIKRAKRRLGWVVTRPKYCQIIRDSNKHKRLA